VGSLWDFLCNLDPLLKMCTHPRNNLMEHFFRFCPFSIPVANIIGLTCVVFNLDPTHFLSHTLLNIKPFSLVALLVFVFRLFHTLSVFYLGFSLILGSLILIAFLLYILSYSFFHLKTWVLFYRGIEFENASASCTTNIPTRSNLITIHKELKVLEIMANQLGYVALPFLLFFGFGIIIGVNYATIRMHSIIPMPYYLAMPVGSVIGTSALFVLLPPASDLYENSKTFLKHMNVLCSKNTYLLRKIKSQQPFRINVGPLFMVKRPTLTKCMTCIIEITINVLLI